MLRHWEKKQVGRRGFLLHNVTYVGDEYQDEESNEEDSQAAECHGGGTLLSSAAGFMDYCMRCASEELLLWPMYNFRGFYDLGWFLRQT
jgi:hypothetical protein